MDRLRRNRKFFSNLSKKRIPERRSALNSISSDELKSVCDLCANILQKRVSLKPVQFRKLHKHRKVIRTLGSRKVSLKRKKKLLHRGGFLGILAPILGAIGSSLLGGLIR